LVWFELRGGCLSCWYWWKSWPSLFMQRSQYNETLFLLITNFNKKGHLTWKKLQSHSLSPSG
jgi:hypothetical protein